ncbi:uncharacterized protein H6S33_002477 [Morchella sextelata]|uniref:uncharacterized protein n=1 Tax=Morchella sextelata TaxID=1174677 RepID=UPI001D03C170|nr:uncharacterized protein H6S33_002477 [Morchella sextelata]KAH0607443.1 hypothetical protein H6S33_002477 [Morchella sextelata]
MPARISFYRPTGQSRRQARSAHDHDVFEGLPVRRWSRDWVSVGKSQPPPPPQPELPLPKETHLLQPMSQALLQAARSSSSTTPKPVPAAPSPPGGRRFMTKRWVRIARNMEGPEPVYLAKVPDRPRRRGEEVVEVVQQQQQQQPTAATRRRVPPPKRKAKPRGRKPGPKKTVSFAEERLRTFPIMVPHNSDPRAPGGPNPPDTVMVDAAPVVVVEDEVKGEVGEEKKEEEAGRKEHPLPPRPAGLPPKPVGAADLGAK